MSRFVSEYLDPGRPIDILDIGSREVSGGSYRPLFDAAPWAYTGADIAPGSNVDLVLADPYGWSLDCEWDVVISGQVLEHVAKPWLWIEQLALVMRKGGICCVIAPHTWRYHEHPIDAWRVWPEGIRGLFDHAGLQPLELRRNETDTVGIARR
jgi:SAM-dependent methyltransferase